MEFSKKKYKISFLVDPNTMTYSNWHKMVEKHNTKKNQQTSYMCNMWNNTVKMTLYCITTRKATEEIKKKK